VTRNKIGVHKKTVFNEGQNLAETTLVLIILGLVLFGMQIYVKRGLQGKVKDLTDIIITEGEERQSAYQQDTLGLERNTLVSTITSDSTIKTKQLKGGGRNINIDETTTYEYESETKGN
jgi:hypothetical protein